MEDVKGMNHDEKFMRIALELANKAQLEEEIPVGAVIVLNGEIISMGQNRRESTQNALKHAEIEAIESACKYLNSWRLTDCELYVTLEPCPMCAGAIINSRISRIIYGAYDSKAGSCGSVINLFDLPYNHKPSVSGGILRENCSSILSNFFKSLRKSKNKVDLYSKLT